MELKKMGIAINEMITNIKDFPGIFNKLASVIFFKPLKALITVESITANTNKFIITVFVGLLKTKEIRSFAVFVKIVVA